MGCETPSGNQQTVSFSPAMISVIDGSENRVVWIAENNGSENQVEREICMPSISPHLDLRQAVPRNKSAVPHRDMDLSAGESRVSDRIDVPCYASSNETPLEHGGSVSRTYAPHLIRYQTLIMHASCMQNDHEAEKWDGSQTLNKAFVLVLISYY